MTAGDARRPPDKAIRAEVVADLSSWSERYPIFESARFPALAATTVAYLPTARREDRALVALVSLWIVAFDALVDEGEADPTRDAALALRYSARVDPDDAGWHAASLRLSGAAEQLDDALRAIVARLGGYRPPAALWGWWAASCRATIAAIVRHRQLGRADRPLLSYAAALPVLIDSIGVRPYLAVGAIVGREPGVALRLGTMAALATDCSLAIRLANDLRTWEKDLSEGGFNTLTALRAELVRDTPAIPDADALERSLAILRARLVSCRARCHAQLPRDGAWQTEAAMVRLVDVVVGIYATHDYHLYREQGD